MRERRKALGGFVPSRKIRSEAPKPVAPSSSRSSSQGTDGRKASTTMVFVRLLSKLLRDKEIGQLVVPIVPDEARTFGMEALFRQVGIYSHAGQIYEPVDMDTLLYYKEASDGQILEEGHQRSRIDVVVHRGRHRLRDPRRQHDSLLHLLFDVRLPADRRSDLGRRRFARRAASCSAAPPGRTTLAGEGLQHQDGNSQLLALSVPELSSPTIRRSPTSSPSSSRTASGGCTSIRRASSTT